MKIVVLKFGGTSVGTVERIKKVANIIIGYIKKRYKVVVVSSAMSGTTNDLIKKSKNVSKNFNSSEYDVLVSAGEQVACALIAGRLNHLGYKSHSWMGWQIPILTEGNYGSSRISKIYKKNIFSFLRSGGIPIIAGFQGVNISNRITTLGRGGSDASAIMCAKFFKAEKCVIYTDVDGVYTTDPKLVSKAKKIKKISYEEMLEMSSLGAKVLQTRSAELAMKKNIQLKVLSSITNSKGTLITNEDQLIEKEMITGVSYSKNESKITISGVPDKPGISATIFGILAKNNINVDMIVQNISQDGVSANLTFTVKNSDMEISKEVLEENHQKVLFKQISTDSDVVKISVIGMGMMSQTGVAEKMFKTLAENSINILAISTSEIKISVLIDKKYTELAVKSLHAVYNLNNIN